MIAFDFSSAAVKDWMMSVLLLWGVHAYLLLIKMGVQIIAREKNCRADTFWISRHTQASKPPMSQEA